MKQKEDAEDEMTLKAQILRSVFLPPSTHPMLHFSGEALLRTGQVVFILCSPTTWLSASVHSAQGGLKPEPSLTTCRAGAKAAPGGHW